MLQLQLNKWLVLHQQLKQDVESLGQSDSEIAQRLAEFDSEVTALLKSEISMQTSTSEKDGEEEEESSMLGSISGGLSSLTESMPTISDMPRMPFGDSDGEAAAAAPVVEETPSLPVIVKPRASAAIAAQPPPSLCGDVSIAAQKLADRLRQAGDSGDRSATVSI